MRTRVTQPPTTAQLPSGPADRPARARPRMAPDGPRRAPARWRGPLDRLALFVARHAERHPVRSDTALAVVMAVATLPDTLGRGTGPLALVLHLALWAPVAFRRRAPVAVFAVLAVVAFGQWLTGLELAADLALLISLYTVAAHRSRAQACTAAAVLEVGVVLATISWGHEDGVLRTFVLLSGVVVAALLLGTTVQSRTVRFAMLQERAHRLEQESAQQAAIAAAAERTRIAREMHDIVAHSLSVMITLADGAALTRDRDAAAAAMRQVSRTGRDALSDTRRVLDVLRDDDERGAPREPAPLLSTLATLLTAVRATGLVVDMHTEGTVFDPTPVAQASVYRIVQEALTNTVRHARATRVSVVVGYDEPALTVEIVDDGATTGTPTAPYPAGHGLRGMRERAALFGGSVTAGADAAGGWRVRADLPDVGRRTT